MKLNVLDKKILYELDVNSRASATKIARKVRASKETVNFRVKRLSSNNVVRRFYAIINMAKLGYSYYNTYVKLQRTNPQIEDEIIQYLRQNSSCTFLRILEGNYDLVFLNVVKSTSDLDNFFKEFKDRFGRYIREIQIHMITKTCKFNHKFLIDQKTERFLFDNVPENGFGLDELDMQILKNLASNGRIKLTELGLLVKADPKVIKYRIRRMEKHGIIVLYTMMLNFDKLLMENVLINISLRNIEAIPGIVEYFDSIRSCLFVFRMLGRYDLSIELTVPNEIVLRQYMKDFKAKFSKDYNFYDMAHIDREHVIGWASF